MKRTIPLIYRDTYTYTISDFTNEKFFIADTTNFTDTCYEIIEINNQLTW